MCCFVWKFSQKTLFLFFLFMLKPQKYNGKIFIKTWRWSLKETITTNNIIHHSIARFIKIRKTHNLLQWSWMEKVDDKTMWIKHKDMYAMKWINNALMLWYLYPWNQTLLLCCCFYFPWNMYWDWVGKKKRLNKISR